MRTIPNSLREYYDLLNKTSSEGGFPAMINNAGSHQCVYRDFHGKACAYGIIIPDDKYDKTFEKMGLADQLPPKLLPPWLDIYTAMRVQEAHDSVALYNKDKDGNFIWSHESFMDKLNRIPLFAEFALCTIV